MKYQGQSSAVTGGKRRTRWRKHMPAPVGLGARIWVSFVHAIFAMSEYGVPSLHSKWCGLRLNQRARALP